MAVGTKAALKKPSSFGTRAWRLLRLAVLWARKGGVASHSLRLLRTLRRHGHGLAGLRGGARGDRDRLRHGEREYSIDETPAFRLRAPSARVLRLIPCIAPPATPGLYGDDGDRYFFAAAREVDDEDGAGYDYCYGDDDPRSARDVEEEEEEELSYCGDDEQLLERVVAEAYRASAAGSVAAGDGGEDAAVDAKAEEFIARFHAQMKLQRQISWLQYNQMMERSIS